MSFDRFASTALTEVANGAGIFIDPLDLEDLANALVTICSDDSLRNSLSERAIEESVRFTWDRAAELALGVLEQAAA